MVPISRVVLIAGEQLFQVVDVGRIRGRGGEQQDPAIGMFVRKEVVKPARRLRGANASDHFDLGGVGKPGDIEDDRAEIAVGRALAELRARGHVVASIELEILGAKPAGPEWRPVFSMCHR